MPIVTDKYDNLYVHYIIPEDIESRIPDYFYYAMAGELVSIFGPTILEKITVDYDEDENEYPLSDDEAYYDLSSGTAGWMYAFIETCRKLDMMWLNEYRKTLEWYDGDIFDGIIEGNIITYFCEKDHTQDHSNCYYKHLLNLGEN